MQSSQTGRKSVQAVQSEQPVPNNLLHSAQTVSGTDGELVAVMVSKYNEPRTEVEALRIVTEELSGNINFWIGNYLMLGRALTSETRKLESYEKDSGYKRYSDITPCPKDNMFYVMTTHSCCLIFEANWVSCRCFKYNNDVIE